MKKTLALLSTGALSLAMCLSAAEFWQSKPWTEWSTKDAQKLMSDSPWAKTTSVTISGPAGAGVGGDGGAARGGGGGGRGGRPGGDPTFAGGGGRDINIVARWQSAAPMKQAFAKVKYGDKAATSAEAKQLIEREETAYIIVLDGPLRGLMRGKPEDMKQSILDESALEAKGKGVEKAADLRIEPSPGDVTLVFAFPRTAGYSLADKEIEFSTKIGTTKMKFRFRLKDMVVDGKLAL